jgi:putative DNA primase/helicase
MMTIGDGTLAVPNDDVRPFDPAEWLASFASWGGYWIVRDPNMERPELRQFKASPFDAVLADRGKYIAAALTVVRAYAAAGFPNALPALASFEDWSRLVRSALVWLGREDPVKTMEAARSEDPITSQLRALFHAWHSGAASKELTAGGIKQLADETMQSNRIRPDLHQALLDVAEGRSGEIDGKRLGHYLGKHKGRVIDGLKLDVRVDAHSKQNLWMVVRV